MKRNKFFMFGIVTVLVAVLSLTFVSNTFAKYTSTVTGQDTARVAKWQWTYKENEEGVQTNPSTIAFNLFDTIKDTETGNTGEEQDVADDLLAPGTQGEFQFVLANQSEVNAKFTLTFDSKMVNNPIDYFPIVFTLYNENNELIATATDLQEFTGKVSGQTLGMGEDLTYTIKWVWAFETGNDNKDTTLGETAQTKDVDYAVTMTVIMEQVD